MPVDDQPAFSFRQVENIYYLLPCFCKFIEDDIHFIIKIGLHEVNITIKTFALVGMAADLFYYMFFHAHHEHGGDGGAAHGVGRYKIAEAVFVFSRLQ